MIEVRLSKKVIRGATASDLARSKGTSVQAAQGLLERMEGRGELPKPLATITTLDDQRRAVKVQKVWEPLDLGIIE